MALGAVKFLKSSVYWPLLTNYGLTFLVLYDFTTSHERFLYLKSWSHIYWLFNLTSFCSLSRFSSGFWSIIIYCLMYIEASAHASSFSTESYILQSLNLIEFEMSRHRGHPNSLVSEHILWVDSINTWFNTSLVFVTSARAKGSGSHWVLFG